MEDLRSLQIHSREIQESKDQTIKLMKEKIFSLEKQVSEL